MSAAHRSLGGYRVDAMVQLRCEESTAGVLMTRTSQIAVLLLLVAASLSGQQPASSPASTPVTSQTPTFKLGVNDVDVDVVVTDKEGGVVRGLTRSDFKSSRTAGRGSSTAFSAVDIPVASAAPARCDIDTFT